MLSAWDGGRGTEKEATRYLIVEPQSSQQGHWRRGSPSGMGYHWPCVGLLYTVMIKSRQILVTDTIIFIFPVDDVLPAPASQSWSLTSQKETSWWAITTSPTVLPEARNLTSVQFTGNTQDQGAAWAVQDSATSTTHAADQMARLRLFHDNCKAKEGMKGNRHTKRDYNNKANLKAWMIINYSIQRWTFCFKTMKKYKRWSLSC